MRVQPCLKFQVALTPPSAVLRLSSLVLWSVLARTDGVFRYVRLPRRAKRSSSQDQLKEVELRGHLHEAAWYGFTGMQHRLLSSSLLRLPLSSHWSSSLSLCWRVLGLLRCAAADLGSLLGTVLHKVTGCMAADLSLPLLPLVISWSTCDMFSCYHPVILRRARGK